MINTIQLTYSIPGIYYIIFFLGMVIFFPPKVLLLVLTFFLTLSHDTELADRSVRAHTLLSVNNQDCVNLGSK